MTDTLLAIALILASFCTALAALVGFAVFLRKSGPDLLQDSAGRQDGIVYLFEDRRLADATEAARTILAQSAAPGDDWTRFCAVLEPRFASLADLPGEALERGSAERLAGDGTSRLRAVSHDGLLRIELTDTQTGETGAQVDRHTLAAMRDELATHRAVAQKAPFLVWRETARGEITWANRAYLDLAEILGTGDDVAPWPPERLFEPAGGEGPERVKLELPEENLKKWFELHRAQLGDETLFTALPIDGLVEAETNLSEFIATLTGTFAHLPIGLAVFDQERKLSLFNPALTDLTMLPAAFLCAQPTLYAFLDRLRDRRMMPEPKDYKGWRRAMAELEEKAANGTYSATWFLPTGQTYRVTGQPHPGGALALLFEDISSEMSLTHRFRAELEMGQAVLDGLDVAVAVFSAGGVLSMTNKGFARLWGSDPSTSMTEITVADATATWGRKCNPTPVWRQLNAFIAEEAERRAWEAPVTLKDGRVLNCRFRPLVQGATMVTFQVAHATEAALQDTPLPARAMP